MPCHRAQWWHGSVHNDHFSFHNNQGEDKQVSTCTEGRAGSSHSSCCVIERFDFVRGQKSSHVQVQHTGARAHTTVCCLLFHTQLLYFPQVSLSQIFSSFNCTIVRVTLSKKIIFSSSLPKGKHLRNGEKFLMLFNMTHNKTWHFRKHTCSVCFLAESLMTAMK